MMTTFEACSVRKFRFDVDRLAIAVLEQIIVSTAVITPS
jgi:hypothetical protein